MIKLLVHRINNKYISFIIIIIICIVNAFLQMYIKSRVDYWTGHWVIGSTLWCSVLQVKKDYALACFHREFNDFISSSQLNSILK